MKLQMFITIFLVCLMQFLTIHWPRVDATANSGNCGRTPPNKTMMVKALDMNGDGKLSHAEAKRCKDCRLKCFCNGMVHAFELTAENDYEEVGNGSVPGEPDRQPSEPGLHLDKDGDGLLSPEEVPDPPDDAPLLPSQPPSAMEILATVDMNGDDGLNKKELRKCLLKRCGLNCPCKRMLRSFDQRAGDDHLLSLDEFYDPGYPCSDEYYVREI